MFKKLRNRIIIITMVVTTFVVILSGMLIMIFSSTTRPEPKPIPGPDSNMSGAAHYDDQELKEFIKVDRREGNERLFVTLLGVGGVVEIAAFLVVYFVSQKIVEPVKDSYDKQKLFVANASHELKTPLAIIQANVEALEVEKNSERWKVNIEDEIAHANKLVLDLLQLAKMDVGSAKGDKLEDVNLKEEVGRRIEVFRPKFAGDILFENTSKLKVMPLSKRDILQLIDILLDNATKYGNKKISVVLDENSITVSNDGTIISKKDQEKVFDRFYQIDKTKDGSGLGLAIAKALCEQNGWNISCKSDKHLTHFIVVFNK